jgi:hypothetical protein
LSVKPSLLATFSFEKETLGKNVYVVGKGNGRIRSYVRCRTNLAFSCRHSIPIVSLTPTHSLYPQWKGIHTAVMGMLGALGKINFTSSNFCLRRQFSASPTQPAPLSPRPWAMITVAVCRFTAGMMRAVGGGIFALFCFVLIVL